MTRRVYLVVFAVLIALGSGPVSSAAPASISGVVRDSAGVPQIGAQVQLLRTDLTVIFSVYTDSSGRYAISSVLPGRYAVKAMATFFLPSLREDCPPFGRTSCLGYEVIRACEPRITA